MNDNVKDTARSIMNDLDAADNAPNRDCAAYAADRLTGRVCPSDRDDLKLAIENMTGGANTVLYDNAGRPSIMCAIPTMTMDDLYGNGDRYFLPDRSLLYRKDRQEVSSGYAG